MKTEKLDTKLRNGKIKTAQIVYPETIGQLLDTFDTDYIIKQFNAAHKITTRLAIRKAYN